MKRGRKAIVQLVEKLGVDVNDYYALCLGACPGTPAVSVPLPACRNSFPPLNMHRRLRIFSSATTMCES